LSLAQVLAEGHFEHQNVKQTLCLWSSDTTVFNTFKI